MDPFDAEAKLEGDGGIQKNLLAELVECEPRKAKVTLNEDHSAIADLIKVKEEVIDGTIKNTDPDFRTITFKVFR